MTPDLTGASIGHQPKSHKSFQNSLQNKTLPTARFIVNKLPDFCLEFNNISAVHFLGVFAPIGKCVISRIHCPEIHSFRLIENDVLKTNRENHRRKEDQHHKHE